MKKSYILLVIVFLLIGNNKVQAQLVQKGNSTIQIGYGFPSVLQFAGQIIKFGYTAADDPTFTSSFSFKGFGPLHFRYEYMVGGRVGLGLSSNFESGRFKFVDSYTDVNDNYVTSTTRFDYSSINAMLRCNFHFLKRNDKLDIYYGMGLGYSHTRVRLQEDLTGVAIDPDEQQYVKEFNDYLNTMFKIFPVAFEEVFGLKAAFNDNTGMYFEVGYSKAICQLGFYAKLGSPKGFYGKGKW